MNKIVSTILFLCCLLTISCNKKTAYYGSYSYDFIGATNGIDRTDTIFIDNTSTYEDSLIAFKCNFGETYRDLFFFELRNKTNEDITIEWPRISFFAPGNILATTAVNRDLVTYVPSKSTFKREIRFTRFSPIVAFHATDGYCAYYTRKMTEIRPTYDIAIRNQWKNLLGTKFGLYFPMKINGEMVNYLFVFEATKLKVKQERPDADYEIGKYDQFPEIGN